MKRIKDAFKKLGRSLPSTICFAIGWFAIILYFLAFLAIPTGIIMLAVKTIMIAIGG